MTVESVCPRCGAVFHCGAKAHDGKCWCAQLPHRPPPDPASAACLCPGCLKASMAAVPPPLTLPRN